MGNPGLGETLLPGAKVDLSPAEGGRGGQVAAVTSPVGSSYQIKSALFFSDNHSGPK